MSEERLSAELLSLLGPEDFLGLVERYGGTRLFIPRFAEAETIAREISAKAAEALGRRYSGFYIRVPLARSFRARQYRAVGCSNVQIARQLGMTESSVDKLFRRMPNKPVKGSGDARQADLFQQ